MDGTFRMRRRLLGAGVVLLIEGARAQPAAPIRLIGVLANHIPRRELELGVDENVAAFVDALRKTGWRDGENVRFIWRSAEGRMDHHPALAAELVGMRVEVIVGGDNAMEAAARATKTIPIVAYAMYNPVENRYARSLAHPGGNVTGVANAAGAELQKALSLLKEVSPRIRRVALVAQTYERADSYPTVRPETTLGKAGEALGLELFFMTFGEPATLPALVASAARQGANALMVDANYAIHGHREIREGLARAAERHRLALMHLSLVGAADGALMAYGANLTDRWRRAAYFVDRILRGEKPGDIPIEHAARVEFHINLKAARATGLQIPATVLLQADRVFE